MGYELNKLMQQYGVSTPGMAAYSGAPAPGDAPVPPTLAEPVMANSVITKALSKAQIAANKEATDKYNAVKAAFDESVRKYGLSQKEYNQYTTDYQNRLANTPMYSGAQFQTTIGTNQTPQNWAAPVSMPTYGMVPITSASNTPQQNADYYRRLRDLGYTDADIREATQKTFGPINEADWSQLLERAYPKPVTETPNTPILTSPTPATGGSGFIKRFRNLLGFEHGGSVHDLSEKYNVGGQVRKYSLGGNEGKPDQDLPIMLANAPSTTVAETPPTVTEPAPVTASPAAQPITPPAMGTTPISPAAADLTALMNRYLSTESAYGPELRAARTKLDTESKAFEALIANAMKGDTAMPDKTEMYFRLAAAFGSPTKTGKFTENVALAGKELGEYAKDVRTAKKAERALGLQLGLEAQKLKMQGARDELTTLRTLAGEEMKDKRAILQEYIKSGRPQSEAGKAAIDAGLVQGTPEFTAFVEKYIDDKIRSGNLLKEAMVTIAAGREQRQADAAKKLSPAEVKLKADAETSIGGLDDAMNSLKRAYKLNPNTFEGTYASIAQQKILEQTDPQDPRVLATREQRNLLGKGAIERLKASFGGNPTEGERAALLELEGLDAKSKEERARIMKNTYSLLKARRDREQKRLNDINAGLYRETTPSTGDID